MIDGSKCAVQALGQCQAVAECIDATRLPNDGFNGVGPRRP